MHETTTKNNKTINKKKRNVFEKFDEFRNILKQLNVSKINFELTINDLKRISIV